MSRKVNVCKKVTAVFLSIMLVAATLQLNVTFSAAAASLNYETIVSSSNFPVININVQNGEDVDRVNKENKKNATFEIKNTNGMGKDIVLTTQTTVDETGAEVVEWPMTIKGRGNSSWTMPTNKKPYNIKFSSKQNLLGMGKSKSWSLIASWLDTSFVRNYVAYKMGKQMKTNAMDCEFVELCINGKYEGLYLLIEKYGIDEYRIETAGDGADVDGDGEVTQFLIESDSRAVENNEPNRFQTESGIWMVAKEPDEEDITTADDPRFTYLTEYMQKVDDAIMKGENYEDYIDLDSLIDVYIVNEVTKNPDFGYGNQPCYSSTFMNMEEGGKLYFGTIWDFDISMARNDYGNQEAEGYRDTFSSEGYLAKNTKWIKELFENPSFEQKVKERWTQLNPVMDYVTETLLPQAIELVRPSAANDFATWEAPSARGTSWNYRTALDYEGETALVTRFLTERIAWLDTQWLVDEISSTYDASWTRSDVEAFGSADYAALTAGKNEKTELADIWDGGYGEMEADGTETVTYGQPQEGTGGDTAIDAITIEGPRGNVNCWWKDDGTQAGGFGGWSSSTTISAAGRYVYATSTSKWWFNQGESYTMGKDGTQIYILDVSPNGSITLHDGAVSSTQTSRTVTETSTKYAAISGSGSSFTLTYKADQTGNAGVTIGGSGSTALSLSFDSSFDGTLERTNRPESAIYASVPQKLESAYVYYEGVTPSKWEVTNKETGEPDNGAIVLFDEQTRKVTANGSGTAVITAYAQDGTSASIEIQSSIITASSVITVPDSRFGKYYHAQGSLQGMTSEKGNWATFAPGSVTCFTATYDISQEDYENALSFLLSTKQKDAIIGGAGNYYLYVNGVPFIRASSGEDTLNVSGFDNTNTIVISKDGDEIGNYARYSYMNGMHAHTDAFMGNLKSLLKPGENRIDIIASSSDGGALVRPYLYSSKSAGGLEEPVEVTEVKITASADELTVGSSVRFAAAVYPANATESIVTWTSSNPEIATVDAGGNVTAVTAGTVIITAEAGGVSAQKTVQVVPKTVTSLLISPAQLTLAVGETQRVQINVLPEDAEDNEIGIISNSNPDVAELDIATGIVTAKAAGTTEITVQAGTKQAVLFVTVEKGYVAVTGVSVSAAEAVLSEGENVELRAAVTPEDATNQTVTWSSSDESIVVVDNGIITAVRAGSAVITVTTADGGKTAQVAVTVNKIDAQVSINSGAASIGIKDLESAALAVEVTPSHVPDKTVVWSSSDESTASVDANGVVTAKKPGTVLITAASCYDSEKSDSIAVVIAKTEVGVKITSGTSMAMDDAYLLLTAEVTPAVYDTSVVWSVQGGTGSARLDGNMLIPVSSGTVIVTAASAYDPAVRESITVTIAAGVVPVESITVSQNSITLEEGGSETVTATVLPEDSTKKDVLWSTSDTSVATVENGTITAHKEGTAVITASADGGKTADIIVTVNKINASVSINDDAESVSIKDLGNVILTARVTPSRVPDQSVVWSTSDTTIAYVEANGVVVARKPGTVTITAASSYDSTKKDTITLIVTKTDITVLIDSGDTMYVGDTMGLSASVSPNVYDTSVVWTVEDITGSASVENGVLTAITPGTVAVTATSVYDSSSSASMTVSISERTGGITIYAPAYDSSRASYPAGAVVYNPADGKYYCYTNSWGIATSGASFPNGWTEVTTDPSVVPDSSSAFSFNKGQIVKNGNAYYTPLADGYWSMWIAAGSNNAYWNVIPAEFSQYFETGTTYTE